MRFLWLPCAALLLTACGTTRPLPPYEPPLARIGVQSVRTTAYTHTEDDHVEYGNRNALGGVLQAARAVQPSPPVVVAVARPVSVSPRGIPPDAAGGFQRVSYIPVAPPVPATPLIPAECGSAAADWSRWPAGTIFRIASTGQVYRVDDYGWALSGRNTIDLYMPSRRAMNAWGLRREAIEVLQWGDPQESLRVLRPRGNYRHIQRMILELEGNPRAAARLE